MHKRHAGTNQHGVIIYKQKSKTEMAKKLIPRLKEGHTIIAKVKSKESEALVMEDATGNEIRIPMLNAFVQALEICESANPILEIKMQNGDYVIYEHDVWPDEISDK